MNQQTVDLVKYLARGLFLVVIVAGLYYLVLKGFITAQALFATVSPIISVLVGHGLYQAALQKSSGGTDQNPKP